jgi:hypothetical protein
MTATDIPSSQPSDAQVSQASREFLHDIFVDDISQKMAVGRAVFAAGYGIDPRPYSRPFPGTQSHVTMASAAPKIARSGLMTAALAALGGAGVTSLVAAAFGAFNGDSPNVGQSTIEPVEYRVIFDGEEGLRVESESGSSTKVEQ